MSFSFVVEDGSGLPAATSYVSVAEADVYFTPDLNYAATWGALTNEQKELSLAWASRILDQKTDWKGNRAVTTSGLRWPRSYAYDRDGILVDDGIVPPAVKQATCELAKYVRATDLTVGPDVENIKRITVDVIEIEYQDQTAQSSVPTIINAILTGLGSLRVGGRGFGKIVKA